MIVCVFSNVNQAVFPKPNIISAASKDFCVLSAKSFLISISLMTWNLNIKRNIKTCYYKEIIKQFLKILLGGCQLSVDSHFSCSMGNLTLAKREVWLYISSNTQWNNVRLVCNKATKFFIILTVRNKELLTTMKDYMYTQINSTMN